MTSGQIYRDCCLMQHHKIRSQPSFRRLKIQAPRSLAWARPPYPQEHRSQMHFLFTRAIWRPGCPRKAFPASPPWRPQPPHWGGGAPSLKGLGKCSQYVLQRKLKWHFCKVWLSVPFLGLALRKTARSLESTPARRPPPPRLQAQHAPGAAAPR